MSKIKVLYIISTLKRTGPVNVLYNIVENLDRNIFDPVIMTLSPEPNNSRYDDFSDLNISICSLNLSRFSILQYGSEIKRVVQGIKPRLIHTHGLRPDYYVVKYLKNYPLLNTIHNYPFADYIMKHGKIRGYLMAYIHINNIFTKIDFPISCSYAIMDSLLTKHNIKTDVVQNGIDEQEYGCLKNNLKRNRLKKELKLNENKKIFIFVGSLSIRKDPITIIEAFKLAEISDKAQLVILGDGPLRDRCEKESDYAIIFKGNVSNVADYLKVSDAFVSASLAEGLPMGVLEALGSGLPLILSDIKPHEEIINKNRVIGKLFPARKASVLAQLLRKFVEEDRDMYRDKCIKTFKDYFTAKVMSNSYQEKYLTVLQSNKQGD